jgi:hypothetical protein
LRLHRNGSAEEEQCKTAGCRVEVHGDKIMA